MPFSFLDGAARRFISLPAGAIAFSGIAAGIVTDGWRFFISHEHGIVNGAVYPPHMPRHRPAAA